jgi:hypothetical protein
LGPLEACRRLPIQNNYPKQYKFERRARAALIKGPPPRAADLPQHRAAACYIAPCARRSPLPAAVDDRGGEQSLLYRCATAPGKRSCMFTLRMSPAGDRPPSCLPETRRDASPPISPSCPSCCGEKPTARRGLRAAPTVAAGALLRRGFPSGLLQRASPTGRKFRVCLRPVVVGGFLFGCRPG